MTTAQTADLNLEGLIHDLNNVFQTVGETAEVLRKDPKWVRLANSLSRCASHGQRLAASIRETNKPPADPATIVASAIQFTEDYLECVNGPKLEFTHFVDPAFRLPGDAAAWERVLVNLFLNAAEAGARNVTITARAGKIIVADNGPGIDPELLPSIFQPHVSTKSIMSGLGLYVVQSIVEQNGGTVTAANGPTGAEFQIALF